MKLHLMEEKSGSPALLEKRSDVTEGGFIIMRRGSIVAQNKKNEEKLCDYLHYFEIMQMRKKYNA